MWSNAFDEAFEDTIEAGAHITNAELLADLKDIADKHESPPRFEDIRKHDESPGAHVREAVRVVRRGARSGRDRAANAKSPD